MKKIMVEVAHMTPSIIQDNEIIIKISMVEIIMIIRIIDEVIPVANSNLTTDIINNAVVITTMAAVTTKEANTSRIRTNIITKVITTIIIMVVVCLPCLCLIRML